MTNRINNKTSNSPSQLVGKINRRNGVIKTKPLTEVCTFGPGEYHLLVFPDYNRVIDPKRVVSVRNKLESSPQVEPIVVRKGKNGKYEVVSGQHRAKALLELGRTIQAVINHALTNYTREEMVELTIIMTYSDNHSTTDALKTYSYFGFDDYVKVKKIVDRGVLTLTAVIQLFLFPDGGNASKSKRFIQKKVNLTRDLWRDILAFEGECETIKNNLHEDGTQFQYGMSKALFAIRKHPNYDSARFHKVMKHNLVPSNYGRKEEFLKYFVDQHNKIRNVDLIRYEEVSSHI